MPSYEYRNGQMIELADLVVSQSGDLREDVNRTLVIQPDVTLTVHGRVSGTVEVQSGATLIARGEVSGTIDVAAYAEAIFHQRMSGTLKVSRHGTATLGPTSSALGTMNVDGTLVNHGTRGGQVHGTGLVDDRDGSTVRQPDETLPDGTVIYRG